MAHFGQVLERETREKERPSERVKDRARERVCVCENVKKGGKKKNENERREEEKQRSGEKPDDTISHSSLSFCFLFG